MSKRYFLSLIFLAGIIAGFCIYFLNNSSETKISHYSYFSQKDFYENAYNNAKPSPIHSSAIIVNHHLLASNFIAETFNILATTAPVTVLLVSPNHFSAGKYAVATSKGQWVTPYGVLKPDNNLINKLILENVLGVDEEPFLQEHGISGLVGFIKKSLPNAKIVPIIFKDQIPLNKALELAEKTYKIIPKNVVVVGSFDFSHYLPKSASNFHDYTSLNTINNFDFEQIYKLDIDSKPGLAFYLNLVNKMGLKNFNLVKHSNSAELTKKDILESTSYITGYYNSLERDYENVETLMSLGVLNETKQQYSKPALEYLQRFFSGQNTTLLFQSNYKTQFNNRGITLVNKSEYGTNLNGVNIKILDCQKKLTPIFYNETVKVVICHNSNKDMVVQKNNILYIYSKGKFLDEASIFTSFGLVGGKNSIKVFFFPISLNKGQFKLLVGQENDTVLLEIVKNSQVSFDLKEQITKGVIEIKY